MFPVRRRNTMATGSATSTLAEIEVNLWAFAPSRTLFTKKIYIIDHRCKNILTQIIHCITLNQAWTQVTARIFSLRYLERVGVDIFVHTWTVGGVTVITQYIQCIDALLYRIVETFNPRKKEKYLVFCSCIIKRVCSIYNQHKTKQTKSYIV